MPLPGLAIGARLAVTVAKRLAKRAMTQRGLPAAAAGTLAAIGGRRVLKGRQPSPFNPRGAGRDDRDEKPTRWYKKDGQPRRIRKDGRPWDVPSLDVSNSKALRRALRRLEGFKKLVTRVEKFMPGRQFKRKAR